jgi:hypothetical protein
MRILLLFIIIVVCLIVRGCPIVRVKERMTETFTFPGGEMIINESCLVDSWAHLMRRNKLSFQQTASASREGIGEINEVDAMPISLHDPAPQLIRFGDRAALVLGPRLFHRWYGNQRRVWVESSSTEPDYAAHHFLRSFLQYGDPRLSTTSARNQSGRLEIPQLNVPYVFHNFDLEQMVFVTRRSAPDPAFPEFLVYSAWTYETMLRFDLERTRALNHLKPPSDAGMMVEYKVVTYYRPQESDYTQNSVFKGENTGETQIWAYPLSASTWTVAELSLKNPNGTILTKRYESKLGFFDPVPGNVSISWRPHTQLWEEWKHVRLDDWVLVEEGSYVGNLSVIVSLRVRRTKQK